MYETLTNKTYIAAAYIRLSVEDDDKNDKESVSIVNQRDFINKFAKENNIQIYDYYVDDGYSGGNFDRPGFKRMINDIECGVINCVITKDTSRLGREFIETGNYMFKYFPEKDIRYIAILENFDTMKPNGVEDIIPFKAVMNDMYLKEVSKKIKSVRHNLMEQGLYVGSTIPYGYKRSEEDNRKLDIDEYSSKIVQRIFEMRNEGMSLTMIARTLTDEGILPPNVYNGKHQKELTLTTNLWKYSTIKHLIQNEAYIGILIQGKYGRVSLKSKKKKLLPKDKWIIKEGVIPPIISKELFEKVNCSKRKFDDTRFVKYDYPLKGLVVCADCGKPMLTRRIKNKKDSNKDFVIYCCRTYATFRNGVCSMHYMREDDINEKVMKELRSTLKKYITKDELTKKYVDVINNSDILQKYEKQLSEYQNKLVVIDKAISDTYVDKTSGIITQEEFISIKKDLLSEKENYINKIDDLKVMVGNSKSVLTDENSRIKIINDFVNMSNPSKQILHTLINKIEVQEDKKINIYYNFNLKEI